MNKSESTHPPDQSCEGPVKIRQAVLEKKIVKDLQNLQLQRPLVADPDVQSSGKGKILVKMNSTHRARHFDMRHA